MAILVGGFLTFSGLTAKQSDNQYCPFCDQKVLDYQKFYEDDMVVALYTHKPVLPGHVLVIPKRHVERFELLTDDEMMHINHTLRKVDQAVSKVFGTSAYLLLQKNGAEVGQSVPHLHFHYIPRKEGEKSGFKLLWAFYTADMYGPISKEEMLEATQALEAEMNQLP